MARKFEKIYFACSIRGGRDDAGTYARIVDHIRTQATVLTEIFADGALTADGMDKPSREIWQTDVDWIRQSDAVIAEVSNPSLGVGYEIGLAGHLHKPVLALYRESEGRKLSAMIDGSPVVSVVRYHEIDETFARINRFINQ